MLLPIAVFNFREKIYLLYLILIVKNHEYIYRIILEQIIKIINYNGSNIE